MRTKKAFLNVASSLLLQLIAVLCGFVIPIALINAFGSETYGAIGSITQFLGFIALLEGGVGGVARAALYKPLADVDERKVAGIVRATESFFRKIGIVFAAYALLIAAVFPYITQYDGEWVLTFSLALVIGTGTLAQYLFGLAYSVLLQADQRNYVSNVVQIVAYVLNALVVVVMVRAGFGVVAVEAGSAVVFVLRPIVLCIYARRRYRIGKAAPDKGALKDKWNGLGHHLAFFFRSNVSVVALSLFAPLAEVAVFTVYNLVANGLQKIVNAFSSGIEAAFGNMIANGEKGSLDKNFRIYELISSTLVGIAFGTAMASILPFVSVYTAGVSDVDYIRPFFAVLLLAATAVYCFRLPYNTVVLAAGHYAQTRNGAFLEAFLAVGLTFVFVPLFGIEGAATALLIATIVRTIQYGVYASRVILRRSLFEFAGRFVYSAALVISVGVAGFCFSYHLDIGGYLDWALFALAVLLTACVAAAVLMAVFYSRDVKSLFGRLRILRQ